MPNSLNFQTNCIFAIKKVGRNKIKPLFREIRIEDIGSEGKAIAKDNDMVIFTQYAVPGDVVDLQVTKKRSRYAEAKVIAFHQQSKERAEAFCAHFGVCGGCKWQILPYEKQLFYKQKQVYDQLIRIGKIDIKEKLSILGSGQNVFYRNKLEFTFSNRKWIDFQKENMESSNLNALGFHVPGLFDKVINIEKCWLQPDPSNQIRNFIFRFAIKSNLTFFDIKQKEGFLRNLIIRSSSVGELMVILSFFYENPVERICLLDALKQEFPEITSLLYVINEKGNDTITDQEILTYYGRDYIYEEMETLRFKIGPKSFYQTNSQQAYNLYKVVREFADLQGNETVYDLYTGTGTIAIFIAKKAKKVIGIEFIPEAIEDAKANAELNNITNTFFYSGDIKSVLNLDFLNENGKPDVIITDPPRAGMHEGVINTLLEIGAEKIVYVSCNPATQARDLAQLALNYDVEKVQPVDMFPQTHHVENVVLLKKKIFL